MNSFTSYLKSGLFDRKRKLELTPAYIQFESKDVIGREYTEIAKADVADIKYSIYSIQWDVFTVGTKLLLEFKTISGETLKFQFSGYFNKLDEYEKKYQQIIQYISRYYLNDIVNQYLSDIESHGSVLIGRLKISATQIWLVGTGLEFEFSNLQLKSYPGYFVLLNSRAPEFHLHVHFSEWHSAVLHRIILTILSRTKLS